MSKTNHTSYGAAATSERELTEDDLALVSGGKP
jgi:bacteriocin-like protein